MGMWRVVALLACLSATQAALFTEGGAVQYGQENKANKNFELAQDEKPANKEYNEKYLKDDEENTQEERYKEYLEGILPILNDDEDKKAIDSMDEYNRFLHMVDQEEEPKTKMERNYYYTEPQFKIDPKLYYYTSSSLLLLAVGTVMCVGLIGTIAGGTYYYKNNRRTETPDDGEYAPYAGTGPGFRKTKGNKGDETLAYKAQLHQYQQAKQKIICGEDAPGIIESDGEDGADEENNYSVYECPGLAPTGDIEVCNPNFAAQP